MKTKIEIAIKPFDVPDFVHEQRPAQPAPAIVQNSELLKVRSPLQLLLSDIDTNTLAKLCNDFTNAVFKAAGKQQPPTQA